jgi:hypothetical protein
MPTARIYLPAQSAMQEGTANTTFWVLDFEDSAPKGVEPLMGWTSSPDTRQQVRLRFGTKEEAVAYCEQNGLPYRVTMPSPNRARRIVQSYADNFAANRLEPWTH